MINLDDYFQYINYNYSDLITEIKEYIIYSDKHNKFRISRLGQCRVDFSVNISLRLREIMPFKISDYGCFKNIPGWNYPIHKDKKRTFAMNMMITEDNSMFEPLYYNDDRTESFRIPYIQNQWVLLNTKKFHSVKNNSTVNRYVISIGCENIEYSTICDLFKNTNSIGLI
jgi:hypothetical protein